MHPYRTSKLVTSAGFHITVACVFSPAALLVTVPLSVVSFFARGMDGYRGGTYIESEHVDEVIARSAKSDAEKNIQAIGRGAITSVWQEATRPLAWTALGIAGVIDGIGYLGEGLKSAHMRFSQNGRDKLEAYWSDEKRRHFVLFNSLRDILWEKGVIAPGTEGIDQITENSALGLGAKRCEKVGCYYQLRKHNP